MKPEHWINEVKSETFEVDENGDIKGYKISATCELMGGHEEKDGKKSKKREAIMRWSLIGQTVTTRIKHRKPLRLGGM